MKIPIILAQGVPQTQLRSLRPGTGPDYTPVARALGEAADVFSDLAKLERKQRLASATVEADEAINTLQNDYDAETVRLKEQGTPERYAQDATDAFDNLSTAAAQALRYPEAQAMFRQKVSPVQSTAAIRARADGVRLQHAQTNSAAQILDREDANAVVFAPTPAERQNAMTRLQTRDATLVSTGVRTTTALPQHLADIDEATARRDFDRPDQRAQVIAGLTAGRYQYLAPDQQLALRDTLVTKAHADRDAQRKDEDRIQRETADDAQRSIVDAVRDRQWGVANDMLQRYGQFMKGEEKRGWAQYIDKAQEHKEDDPESRRTLSIIVNTSDTPATIANARRLVIGAVGAGRLSPETGDKYLGHLQGLDRANRNRVEDKALDAYHRERAEIRDLVKEDLRVTGPLAAILPQAQTVYAMALDDYNRNVPVDQPTGEGPRAWYNRTRAQWVSHVTQAATARLTEISKQVRYKDKAALNADRTKFTLPNGDLSPNFYDQARLLRDADLIRKEMNRLQGKPPDDAGPDATSEGQSFGFPKK